jgi:Nif-specific regulatory protein
MARRPQQPSRRKGEDGPRQSLELECLSEISEALSYALDLKNTFQHIFQIMADRLGMGRGTLTLLNPRTGELAIEIAHGLTPEEQRRGRYRLGEGITGRVVETGQPMVIPRIGDEPLFLDRTRSRSRIPKSQISFLCVPIIVGRNVMGAISVDRLFTEGISLQEDLRLLTIIAAMVGQAVNLHHMIQEEKERLIEENIKLHQELQERYRLPNIVGNSRKMQDVFKAIEQVAPSEATVLLRGESGTGKELAARAIHYNSPRAKGPFIGVSCAALPESLIETELFGHERGAFTGALASKKGRFEAAHGGTIFLDEVGDLSPTIQVKLLRVVQERAFERLGGSRTMQVDVRIIAATHQDLETAIQKGRFREDLYYRLNVFPIYLPPLRERRTDILLLAEHFLEKYSQRYNKQIRRISTPAIDMLMAYHWPGNVRELENWIERAVIVCNEEVIYSYHFPATLQTAEATGTQVRTSLKAAVAQFEREMIIDALKSTRGNRTKAAQLLQTTDRILGYKIQNYGIEPRKYKA